MSMSKQAGLVIHANLPIYEVMLQLFFVLLPA